MVVAAGKKTVPTITSHTLANRAISETKSDALKTPILLSYSPFVLSLSRPRSIFPNQLSGSRVAKARTRLTSGAPCESRRRRAEHEHATPPAQSPWSVLEQLPGGWFSSLGFVRPFRFNGG